MHARRSAEWHLTRSKVPGERIGHAGSLAEVLERFDDLAAEHRHVEFFVVPYTDEVILKRLHEAPGEGEFAHSEDIDETVFRSICEDRCAFASSGHKSALRH